MVLLVLLGMTRIHSPDNSLLSHSQGCVYNEEHWDKVMSPRQRHYLLLAIKWQSPQIQCFSLITTHCLCGHPSGPFGVPAVCPAG